MRPDPARAGGARAGGRRAPSSQIANRLVLSERTVDHHVGAALGKLDVRTSAKASAKTVRLELAG